LDHLVDHLEQEARLDPPPADALDHRAAAGRGVAVARAPAGGEGAAGRVGDAQPAAQAAVAQVAADRGRGAAGAGAADHPRRLRLRFAGELANDRFGDVVVAAPVGGAFGQAELVEVAGALCGVPGGAFVDLRGVVDEVAVAAKRLYVGDLARRGG